VVATPVLRVVDRAGTKNRRIVPLALPLVVQKRRCPFGSSRLSIALPRHRRAPETQVTDSPRAREIDSTRATPPRRRLGAIRLPMKARRELSTGHAESERPLPAIAGLDSQVAKLSEVVDHLLIGHGPFGIPPGVIDVSLHPSAVQEEESPRLPTLSCPVSLRLVSVQEEVEVALLHGRSLTRHPEPSATCCRPILRRVRSARPVKSCPWPRNSMTP
jgi:hypothetical protein